MKLLQRTRRYYFWYSTLIFALGGVILLLTMRYVISREADEQLQDAKAILRIQLEAMDSLPSSISISDNVIEISPLPYFSEYEKFSDTTYWNAIEKEDEPYRKFTYHDLLHGKPYRIHQYRSKLDSEELIATILVNVLGILALLLLAINLATNYLSQRIWSPFHQTIRQIENFTFEQKKPLSRPATEIDEFATLHRAIEMMTTKTLHDYQSLKQFTENASHEIQTPLAIIKGRIELLMQKENRNENELIAMQQIQEAATRLAKLNHSLLLLTRIENRQYTDTQSINLKEVIEKKISQFEPFVSAANLEINTNLTDVHLSMDPTLAEVLLNNLLGNAIKYCLPNGLIDISLSEKHLYIRNQGVPLKVEPNDLFERFRKDSDTAPSLGLGLAIVKEICTSYRYDIFYEYADGWHKVTVSF